MSPAADPHERFGTEPGSASRRVALGGSGVAIAIGVIVLVGWLGRLPTLSALGSGNLAMQPLSALACLCLGASIWTGIYQRRTISLLLLVIPAIIAATTLIQTFGGTRLGIDTILFRSGVLGQSIPFPGRPRIAPTLAMVLLGAAILFAARRSRPLGSLAVLLASFALAITLLSLIGPLIGIGGSDNPEFLGASRAGGLAGLGLSIAILAWRGESGWPSILQAAGVEGRILRTAFPLVLLTPVLTALLEIWLRRAGADYAGSAPVIAAGLNVLAMAALLFWVTGRMLRERDERFELVRALDAAPIALARLDGTILHWSDGCAELYGFSAAEAVGRIKAELLQTITRGGSAIPADRVGGEERSEIEIVETARDGAPLHIIEQARLLPSRAKREPLVVLSMTDISARTRAEEALRESQVRLSLALESHRIGAFDWDAATGKFRWSTGSEERLGLTPGTIVDFESWEAHVDATDFAAIRYTMDQAIAHRAERFSFHFRFVDADGKTRTIEGASRCFYDGEGNILRIVGINFDVTERVDREAELEARQAQLRSILETVPDAMIVIDDRGIIHAFSTAAERLFGYPAEEIVDQSIAAIMPAAASGIRGFIKRSLRQSTRNSEPLRFPSALHRDGREIPVEVAAGEAVIGGERLLTIFVRDVSERVATELRMAELNSELLHAARLSAMGEMAEGLAHELNQPLTASVNFLTAAELLMARGDADLAQLGEFVGMARAQALRTGDIIRRLRAFLGRGEVEVRAEPVDEVVRDAVALVAASSLALDLVVDFDLHSQHRMMLVDRVQVQQVLVNLLRNAVEALGDGDAGTGEIRIATRCLDPHTIEISVADNGPGLPENFLESSYKGFSSTKEDGMGVGLSISRRIIEAHGGKLTAENQFEGGAIFRFTLETIEQKEMMEA